MSGEHAHSHAPGPASTGAVRLVHCVKLKEELPGLDAPPWPGEVGQRIFSEVSARAWSLWEERQKMILNEYRLLPFQKEAQVMVAKQMEEFFFSDATTLPPGFVAEKP